MHDDTNLSETLVDLCMVQVETFQTPQRGGSVCAMWGAAARGGSASIVISVTLNPHVLKNVMSQ